ncbi:MAG: beta-lactamase family protein [bacterium]|nr:beta-lactamase family protein [bacterium]
MSEQQVPGLTLAVFDDKDILWSSAFGHTSQTNSVVVEENTRFSAQSTTKLLTALALLQASEKGLVDLEAPISRYLPELQLQSVWGEHPENRIKVGWLLDHRSGLPHEAAVNNNYDLASGSYTEHLASIANVWLKYQPGSRQAYSNIGYSLAGRILEKVAGQDYATYVKENILAPLAMERSTYDRSRIASDRTRARGHSSAFSNVPELPDIPPAGGLYTTSPDLARLIQCLLRKGQSANGEQILSAGSCNHLATLPYAALGQSQGHCLGMEIQEQGGIQLHLAPGRGFGFIGGAAWLPTANLGIVIMANSQDTDLPYRILARFLEYAALANGFDDSSDADVAAMTDPTGEYVGEEGRLNLVSEGERYFIVASYDPGRIEVVLNGNAIRPLTGSADFAGWTISENPGHGRRALVDLRTHQAYLFNTGAALKAGRESPHWRNHTGHYRIQQWGQVVKTCEFSIRNGHPFWDDLRLTEERTDVFFTPTGEVLDLRQEPATYRNIILERE